MKQLATCISFILFLCPFSDIRAQLIQQFNFTGALGNEVTLPPDGQPANGSLSTIRRGSGIQPSNANNVFSAKGFGPETSVDTADYFAFAVQANSGFQLNLDSLVFGQKRSPSGVRTYSVRSSLDGFAQDLLTDSGTVAISWNNKLVTGSSFQGIPASQALEFRFYGYNCPSTNGTWRLDSVRIFGSISSGGGVVSKPKLNFNPSVLSFAEANGPQQATLQMSAAPSIEVSGALYLKSGTASAGTDFQAFDPIPFSFTPGGGLTLSKSVTFLDDAVTEPSETLSLVARKLGLASDTAFDLGADSLFTFTITDNDVPPPPSLATRTIAQILGSSSGNQADSVGKSFRVFGTVYGLNQRLSATAGGYQMFIRDATGGMGIFKAAPVSGITALNEGDSVRIMGKIEGFRGLTQINPDSMVVIATGRPIKTPVLVSTIGETQEADLVKMENLVINPITWPSTPAGGGFTAKAFNGTDTISIRIDNDCELFNQPLPSGTLMVTGMVGQFVPGNPTPVAPFPATGYQLIPRRASDITVTTGIKPSCSCSRAIQVQPNPGTSMLSVSGEFTPDEILRITDLRGAEIAGFYLSNPVRNSFDVSRLPEGVFLLRFSSGGQVIRWIKASN